MFCGWLRNASRNPNHIIHSPTSSTHRARPGPQKPARLNSCEGTKLSLNKLKSCEATFAGANQIVDKNYALITSQWMKKHVLYSSAAFEIQKMKTTLRTRGEFPGTYLGICLTLHAQLK